MKSINVFDPVSTCRIQFSKDFTFNDLTAVLPYLEKLGIRTIYASPVFKAIPGSEHGYNVINPVEINPEIGTADELKGLKKELQKHAMGWVQDIVPNHMAYDPRNEWIDDIFRKGPHSEYYNYFDIDWEHHLDELKGKVLLPFFGKPLQALIDNNELTVKFGD
ncbi:MAG TPA: alpha-amylase family glycosyl hydrolase, partial [Bacteroidales bacterium]|nr:alpha-amylase family glycosyl hydrolase [Bacteroidales bacterium]